MTTFSIYDIEGNFISGGEFLEVPATPYGGCCASGGDNNPLIIAGNELASVGDLYTASGGVPPYVFSFPEGTISTSGTVIDVGEILTITACGAPGDPRTGTIIVTDSIGQTDSKAVRLYGGEFVDGKWVCPAAPVLAGSEDINVGDIFTVTSGGVGPYVFTFPEGTISDEGEILTITACASSGVSRAGNVTVTDASGQTDSIEGRLTGGVWVEQSDTSGDFESDCFNNGFPDCHCCETVSTGICGATLSTATIGKLRYEERWYGMKGCAASCTAFVVCACTTYTPDLTPVTHNPIPTCGSSGQIIRRQQIYEWVCP